ncbi:aminotransferase class IV [Candidatus Saccharibacteria bacterium]|nr:MAG: aminotransferase class IV [Candidatus Saccharibacteria bacterium]
MSFQFFSHNGAVLPLEKAVVPLASIEYSYGFGVYETIRVSDGKPRFIKDHCQRLQTSADTIGLEHNYKPSQIEAFVTDIVKANEVETCNVKVLLIGSKAATDADIYILCLAPYFVDRKLYKTGCHCTTYEYERMYPHAKTLNMLPSYLAYRDAVRAEAHDALLINRRGEITEGTRSNFFVMRDTTIFSPPESDILLGVTRDHVLKLARAQGFDIVHQPIPLDSLASYDTAFLTSTSAKILPIHSVDAHCFNATTPSLANLIHAFNKTY